MTTTLQDMPDTEYFGMLRSVVLVDTDRVLMELVDLHGKNVDVEFTSTEVDGQSFFKSIVDALDPHYGRFIIIVVQDNEVMFRLVNQQAWLESGLDRANGLGLVNSALDMAFTPQEWLWFGEDRRFNLLHSAREKIEQHKRDNSQPSPVIRDSGDVSDTLK